MLLRYTVLSTVCSVSWLTMCCVCVKCSVCSVSKISRDWFMFTTIPAKTVSYEVPSLSEVFRSSHGEAVHLSRTRHCHDFAVLDQESVDTNAGLQTK